MSKKTYIICRDRNKNKVKIAVRNLKFRPSVYGIIIKNDKILLSPQWDGYDFPGGGINLGETIDEALEREVWEETGLKVKRGLVVACESEFFIAIESRRSTQSILIYFLCTDVKGKITNKHFDADEKIYAKKAEWVYIKKALKLKFYNGVNSPKLIKQALKLLNQK